MATAIRAAAATSKSEGYTKKAANAVEKLNDFAQAKWGISPWWLLQNGTALPKLATPCPILQW